MCTWGFHGVGLRVILGRMGVYIRDLMLAPAPKMRTPRRDI